MGANPLPELMITQLDNAYTGVYMCLQATVS